MNAIIDYIAWIAIGLGIVAVLFVLAMAYILMDEGVRRVARSFRQAKTAQTNPQNVQSATANLTAALQSGRALWSAVQPKLRAARLGTFLHIHIGHNKTADAKP